ncbi:atherin-like [Panicum virgatum]|uniref:atherin-like n=1 Tax=Panicum virgatum TaxID=38727 RepID=UPI0019D58F90|nr:atherin-like [Panicum virgatum]
MPRAPERRSALPARVHAAPGFPPGTLLACPACRAPLHAPHTRHAHARAPSHAWTTRPSHPSRRSLHRPTLTAALPACPRAACAQHAFHAPDTRRAGRRFAWPHSAAVSPPEPHRPRAATPPAAQRPASPLEPRCATPS